MVQNNPNVKKAYDFFQGRGYSHSQSAGIIGNLMGESSLNTGAVGDGGRARGIAQWHPDRWQPLSSWAKAQGKDPDDFTTQLEMVDYELRNKEKRAFNALMRSKTVDEATAAFIGFERPAGFTWNTPRQGHNYGGRLSYANQVFSVMNGTAPEQAQGLGFTGEKPSAFSIGTPDQAVQASATGPMEPYTRAEEREREAAMQAEKPDVGLWQATKDAVNTTWTGAHLWSDNPQAAPDPAFRLNEENLKVLTKDLPERYWDRLGDAQSMAHAEVIRKGIVDSLAAEQRLAGMGAGGVALQIAAGVVDPLAWAAAAGVSVATVGTGAPAALAARFGRMGVVAANAFEGAAGTAIAEGIRYKTAPTAEASDIYWGIGTGLALGGAYGTIARNPATAKEAARLAQIGKELREGAAMPSRSIGAAQINPKESMRLDTADIVRDAERVAPVADGLLRRLDSAGTVKGSDNPLASMIGNVIVEDGVRNAAGEITPIAASEVQQRLKILADVKWSRNNEVNYKAWRKDNPKQSRSDFHRAVTNFVRDRDLLVEHHPSVAAQGNIMRQVLGEFAELAANPGLIDGTTKRAVRGFEGLSKNDFYVPRMFDKGAISAHLNMFGHKTLSRMIAMGIKEVNQDVSQEVAEKFAYNYVRKLHSLSAGDLQLNSRALSGEDLDSLKTNFLADTDLSEVEIDKLVAHLKPSQGDGASRHGKRRAFYDENFGMMLPFSNGQPGSQFVRISDLFINDADVLMNSYTRQMSGRIAMARMEIKNPKWVEGDSAPEYFAQGITSDGEWQTLMSQVTDVGDKLNIQGDTAQTIERLNWMYDTIVGRPQAGEGSNFNQALRMLRDYNFIRVMGQVGFAQLSEFANTVSHVGLKAAFTNIPSARSMWRMAKNGRLGDDLANEIEDTIGAGTDWVRHSAHRREDLWDNPLDTWNNDTIQTIDDALQRGKRAVSALSGMAPINTALQRWTGRAIFNKFANMALDGVKEASPRMKALGLSDEMMDRVMTSIRDNAKFEGKRLRGMQFEKWSDREAVAAFQDAAFRLSRTIVQENDIGQMSMWMSKPLARTFLQFRSFSIGSFTKQTLQGLNFKDPTTAMSWIGTTFAAGLVYMARTHSNAMLRSDREEYLEKRLSLGRIAAAAVQNSAWASIMPMLFDTAASPILGHPVFDARNTQLGSDAILGNPTADLLDSSVKSLAVIGDVARGNTFSQADARTMARVLPFQNLNGIAQLFSGMISQLPEWAPKK